MGKLTPAVDPAFAIKLGRFIRYNSSRDSCDTDRADELAKKFKVLVKDLKSWAAGESAPSPMKKQEISNYLDLQKDRA